MSNRLKNFLRDTQRRRYVRVAAFAVFVCAILVLLYPSILHSPILEERIAYVKDVFLSDDQDVDEYSPHVLREAGPVSLSIPKIKLETTFEAPLGVHDDQTIEVPESFEQVGWYKYGPTPGELGPAIVLGHVDSKDGPAVFYSLGQLTKGDEIHIGRDDGSIATFEVIELSRFEQSGFPSDLVYGNINYAGLRLVTCSGIYDRETKRYSHNLVVFARLKDTESK